jgi:hypothetical protein
MRRADSSAPIDQISIPPGGQQNLPGRMARRRPRQRKISSRLHIAVHTVKSHVHNVLEKLALHSRLEVDAFSHASGGSKGFSK